MTTTYCLDWYKVLEAIRDAHVANCNVKCCKDCATIYEIREAKEGK